MARFYGTNRSEIVYGSNFRDIIHGNGGNDDLYGRDGADDLYGDAGNDKLYGGYGDDYMRGGEGQNTYTGGYGYDMFAMSNRSVGYTEDRITDFRPRSDKIDVSAWGVSSFDQILAIMSADGNNHALLKAGFGGTGHFLTIANMRPSGLTANDFIFSYAQGKTESGTQFSDTMFGSRFEDSLNGGDSADKILGGSGDDLLRGGRGNDTIEGGAGSDTIWGGRGSDTVAGGAGSDKFSFTSVDDSAPGAHDVITDFISGRDMIDVSAIDANNLAGGDQAFEWIGDSVFTAVGQLAYAVVSDGIVISGNTDSDTASEFEVKIIGVFTPKELDFIL